MKEKYEVQFEHGTLFFEEFDQIQTTGVVHDKSRGNKKLRFSSETLTQAAKPLMEIINPIHQNMLSTGASELELTMQIELAANGETPVFKVLSVGSKCQISVKYVWKKE